MILLKYRGISEEINPIDFQFIAHYLFSPRDQRNNPQNYRDFFYRFEYLESLGVFAVINGNRDAKLYMNPFIQVAALCDLFQIPIETAVEHIMLDFIGREEKVLLQELRSNQIFNAFPQHFGSLEPRVLSLETQDSRNEDVTNEFKRELMYSQAKFFQGKS